MDVVYKFSYATFDKALYRYSSREIHEFMNLSHFVPNLLRYMCAKIISM